MQSNRKSLYWKGALKYQKMIPEEDTIKEIIKTLDYDGEGLRCYNWIVPLQDVYILKMNLINKRENSFQDWMDKSETLGYRYCHDPRDEELQKEFQKLIKTMVFGYLRKDGKDVITIIGIKKYILAYAMTHLAIFRSFREGKWNNNNKPKSRIEKYYKNYNDWHNDWKTECQCKWIKCKEKDGIYRVEK